jgi:hypothetical protein
MGKLTKYQASAPITNATKRGEGRDSSYKSERKKKEQNDEET